MAVMPGDAPPAPATETSMIARAGPDHAREPEVLSRFAAALPIG
jgi:hypothetical protein